MLQRTVVLLGVAWFTLAGCSEDIQAPTAVPGQAQQVTVGALVQLDGSQSKDPDQRTLSYHWSFQALPAGSGARLNEPSLVNPSFTADRGGEYVIRLVVSNGVVHSPPAEVIVTAGPCGAQPPVIAALRAIPAAPGVGSTVQLSATVQDPDRALACGGVGDGTLTEVMPEEDRPLSEGEREGAVEGTGEGEGEGETEGTPEGEGAVEKSDQTDVPLLFHWRLLEVPTGSQAALNDPAVRNPSLVTDAAGTYLVELTVIDETGLASAPRTVAFAAGVCGGAAPVVEELSAEPARPDVGATVVLEAILTDADNAEPCNLAQHLSYHWSLFALPPASQARLNSEAIERPSFTVDVPGTYIVSLVTADATGRTSAPYFLEVESTTCHAAPPQIDELLAAPANPHAGEVVQLTARLQDPDATLADCDEAEHFTYVWSLLALPAGSQARLNDPTASNPSFSADLPGRYTFGLQVRDSYGLPSQPAELVVQVSECGTHAPVVAIETAPAAPRTFDTIALTAQVYSPDSAVGRPAEVDPGCDLPTVLEYTWSMLAQPFGSRTGLVGETSRTPSFLADLPGAYQVALVVADNRGHQTREVVTIEVSGCGYHAPVVEELTATPAQPATGQVVQLSAVIADEDAEPDGCALPESLEHRWTIVALPAGSQARLNVATAANPSFLADLPGEYLISLQVADHFGLVSEVEWLTVEVSPCGSARPTATIEFEPAAPGVGTLVALQAQPTDADGEAPCNQPQSFGYHWTIVAAPAGSSVALELADSRTPSLVPDLAGEYQVALLLTDVTGMASDSITQTITVGECGAGVPVVEAIEVNPAAPGVGDLVALTPTATDPDNGEACQLGQGLGYHWAFLTVPMGSQAILNDPGVSSPSFVPDVPGMYELVVRATDSTGRVGQRRVQVTVATCGSFAPVITAIDASPDAAPFVGAWTQLRPIVVDEDNSQECALGQPLTYHWLLLDLPLGSGAALNDPTAATPSFLADRPGAYLFRLVVTDSTGRASDPYELTVTAGVCGSFRPTIQAIEAMPSLQPATGQTVQLRYTAVDADGAAPCNFATWLRPTWTLVELPLGSQARLNDAGAETPSLTPDVPGDYGVTLVVTDETGLTSVASRVTIRAAQCGAAAPVIQGLAFRPGAPATGTVITLEAAVDDPDNQGGCNAGQILAYHWQLLELPAGSQAALNQPAAKTPSFVADQPGTYLVRLVVEDGTGRWASRDAPIAVAPCGSHTPTIDAGSFQFQPATPIIGEPVGLSLNATDPDLGCLPGELLQYHWEILELPAGSQAQLNDPTLVRPSFVPDLPGEYQFGLAVTDSTGRMATVEPGRRLLVVVGTCGGATPQPRILVTPNQACNDATVQAVRGIVQLDGGQSVDSDNAAPCSLGQALHYTWELFAAPAGSQVELSSPTVRNPWLTIDRLGDYQVRLFVSDGEHVGGPVTCTLRVAQ